MYGAPECVHYNVDCAQMARHYHLPCYSTNGVADAEVPGIQATVEKLMTYFTVPRSGAQYIHYSFGLLERTNVFCPEQAVMDNAHLDIAKRTFAPPAVSADRSQDILDTVREVMASDHKTYIYHLPIPTQEDVYLRYPLESDDGGALRAAHEQYHAILDQPRDQIDQATLADIRKHVPNVLDASLQ
jgi:trimethylamine--corrinoid protein Co-methyltransferase